MRAKLIERAPMAPAPMVTDPFPIAAVGLGGPVAEWQRLIQQRYAAMQIDASDQDPVDRMLRHLSRGMGYGALLAGYAGISLLILR